MSRTKDILTDVIENLDIACDITENEEAELLDKLAPLGSVSIKEKIEEVLMDMGIGIPKTADVSFSILKGLVTFTKWGNVVHVRYSSDTVASVPNGNLGTIGTLPAGMQPFTSFTFRNGMTNNYPNIQFTFNNDGTVTAYNYGSAVTTSATCRFSTTYICN